MAVSLVEDVQRQLDMLPNVAEEPALAGLALAMAEKIELGKGSASECALACMKALSELRALAPPVRKADGLDELDAKRVRRQARPARAADQPGS